MVVILVLLMVAVCLLVGWRIERRRERAIARSRAIPFDSMQSLFMHPGHSWVRATADGLLSVGASEFATNFAGEPVAVELPRAGKRLRQGEPAWTLVSQRGRKLTQVMPVSGKILAVNDELQKDPGLAIESPYDEGWILRVRPRSHGAGLRNLFRGPAATAWREAVRGAALSGLNPAVGRVAQDGGDWVMGFGDRLEDEVWDRVRRDLFPVVDGPDASA